MKINESKIDKETIEKVTNEMLKDLQKIRAAVEEFIDTYGTLIEIETYYDECMPIAEIKIL